MSDIGEGTQFQHDQRTISALRAELAVLERANKELNVKASRLYSCCNELQDVTKAMDDPAINNTITLVEAITAMRAEVAALRRDAERYRWLRGEARQHSERWPRWNLQRWSGTCWHSLERTALDAAIDAALAKEGK